MSVSYFKSLKRKLQGVCFGDANGLNWGFFSRFRSVYWGGDVILCADRVLERFGSISVVVYFKCFLFKVLQFVIYYNWLFCGCFFFFVFFIHNIYIYVSSFTNLFLLNDPEAALFFSFNLFHACYFLFFLGI